MTDKRRLSTELEDQSSRPSGEGADLASTDMSAEPGSRSEQTQPGFGQGGDGLPMEMSDEAVRRLESQLEESKDRQLRLAAEFDNYRKRVARERVEQSDRAQASLVTKLLDVLDDMDRLSVEGGAASADSLRQAMGQIHRKLRKELEAAGLERIDPVGQSFDPGVHEAVSTLPPPTPDLDHKVSATFQTGYRFKGALVRPARVQVYATPGQA